MIGSVGQTNQVDKIYQNDTSSSFFESDVDIVNSRPSVNKHSMGFIFIWYGFVKFFLANLNELTETLFFFFFKDVCDNVDSSAFVLVLQELELQETR